MQYCLRFKGKVYFFPQNGLLEKYTLNIRNDYFLIYLMYELEFI